MENGILLLEDGTAWEGKLFGAHSEIFGEAIFNTAFSGYEEVLTDPSYAGQIVVMSSPHLGNYGISLEDMESSRCYLRGFIVKDLSIISSSWRAKETLEQFLSEQSVVGLCDVDTRGIVKHLRQQGAMRALISNQLSDRTTLLERVKQSPGIVGANFMSEVSYSEIKQFKNKGKRVLLYDFGLKLNILNSLLSQNFEVFVLPAMTPPEKALSLNPDGILLSNGPGDPSALGDIVDNTKELIRAKIPMMGICLGYQILSLAFGAKTYKLKFGHRGVNHPVKNLESQKVSITSHNHGFAVDSKSLPQDIIPTHEDLYDKTLEGFRHRHLPIWGIQFHPEAAPGPHDASSMFDQFRKVIHKEA